MYKRIIGLVLVLILIGIVSLSVVGCGKYKDKCNPEYYLIGQTMYQAEEYGYTLNEKIETLIIETNKDEKRKETVSVGNVGDVYDFNGKKGRLTIERFELSKENNEDNQFSDAQFGILDNALYDLCNEYNEFTESEFAKEKINDNSYEEAIGVYLNYMNSIKDLLENYDGELNEKELMELEYANNEYKNLKEDLAEEMIDVFMDTIFDF